MSIKLSKYDIWNISLKIVQICVLIATGIVIVFIINRNQQKLLALQIFNDKLMGDRIKREAMIKVIKQLGNTELEDSLIEISNHATLEMLRYDIWNDDPRVREDAIKEYAKLYKKYQLDVLDALMPRGYHLQYGNPIISIAKFFYYLEIYSDSLWYGTKLDLKRFMTIKKSKFYNDTINYPHLQRFMDICLKNFRERDTVYPKQYINLHESNIQDKMIDDSVMIKSYTVILSDEGERNLNTKTLKELRDGRLFECSKIDDQGSFFYMEIPFKDAPYKKVELSVPRSYIKFFYSGNYVN